ncbi:glycosyl transferase group 1 [Methanococcus aeolicus Nankai-3]|uniref:Glycosyl transferase group 1 n=1 Tax=Methanococcus aeolicus (strain ATCC BAA-1280 / DSM 17508 / OCM 812 / Nankai-3) TaxID=419665 RepID=A6UU44_META3|nr:glycosyltransferase family 4 protein [Methanococcus aeolicus]ABR56016.1 glycosyl transferase group 1 [Methanococcus aeolicus Nankai-3]
MRIAMIIEAWKPIWGGGQAVAYEIGKRLSKDYDVKIDLFVMNLVGYEGEKIEQINENFRIIHVGKKRNWCFKDRIIWIFELMKEILNYHKKEKYDLIYAHANLPGFLGKILSILLGVPIVYHVHGSGIETIKKMYGKGLKSKFLYIMEVFLQRIIKYDVEITVDRKFLQYKNINRPIYIPNGVDLKKFENINAKKEDKFFKILFVGRLHPQKGLMYLVDAVSLIKNELPRKVRFVIVGEGDEKNNLINKIRYLGLEDLFVFKGRMFGDDLSREYESSHLFILPSLYEGFPLTVLEAWACKLPVLATSVGELSYIIKEDHNGWLVDPGNCHELAEKLKYILQLSQKKVDEIGLNGYYLVKKEYCWDIVVDKIIRVIKNVA